MSDIRLSPGIPGGNWARLRALRGHDETLIGGAENTDLVAFVDQLLMEAAGTTVRTGKAAELAVSDFDRLCASIYIDCFGEFIESRAACRTCQEPFEMRFSLLSLIQDLDERRSRASGPDEHGIFTSVDGRRFRLPTVGEQREVSCIGAEAATAVLLERCLVDGTGTTDQIEESMEEVGPVLNLDLDALCPHCASAQPVRFDMRSFLYGALSHEKQFLLYEVHRIALAYRWSHDEILSLSRNDRRSLVRLIESERATRRRTQLWTDI